MCPSTHYSIPPAPVDRHHYAPLLRLSTLLPVAPLGNKIGDTVILFGVVDRLLTDGPSGEQGLKYAWTGLWEGGWVGGRVWAETDCGEVSVLYGTYKAAAAHRHNPRRVSYSRTCHRLLRRRPTVSEHHGRVTAACVVDCVCSHYTSCDEGSFDLARLMNEQLTNADL